MKSKKGWANFLSKKRAQEACNFGLLANEGESFLRKRGPKVRRRRGWSFSFGRGELVLAKGRLFLF